VGYIIEALAEDIILITLVSPFDPTVDLPALHLATAAACAAMRIPITRVVDLSPVWFAGSEWASTLYEATRKRAGSLSDPRFFTVYVVGENKVARLLVQHLGGEEFGDLHFDMVTTLDEALERVGAV
jgi:hypothetical protein